MRAWDFGKWKIWMSDGKVYEGECLADMDKVPKTGVLVTNQLVNGARRTMYGHNFYWMIRNEICGGDYPGLIQHLMQPGKTSVWFGVNVGSDLFDHFLQQAVRDPQFPTVASNPAQPFK